MKYSIKLKLRIFLKKFDLLMLIVSLPIIPMLIAEFSVGINDITQAYFNMYYLFLWIVFTVEYFLKLYIANNKLSYIRENWIDALVILAPVFRSFKVFHILRTPILLVSDEVLKLLKTQRLNFLYFFIVSLVVIFVSADLVLFFEKPAPGANITTFEDAVWWGIVTFSTLGYGDRYPITFGGRVVAVFLMTLGFVLFSIMVAGAASFFMRRERVEIISSTGYDFVDIPGESHKLNTVLDRLDDIERKLDSKLEEKK
ncbi:MAG: ion channel [Patescibacteria group bacterium]